VSAILFEVEQTAWIAQHLPIVLARLLVGADFTLGDAATLGGCLVQEVVAIPPALRADGTPRVDLFAFALVEPDELARFAVGEVVELLP
jgi:hypothetical protein